MSINKSLFKSEIKRNKPHIDHHICQEYKKIEGFWIMEGECVTKDLQDDIFVFTKTVRENLKHIARTCSAQLPCLVQGDTSIGKTSLIKWLAKATNNTLIRINNHDHTDLQEYIGSYVLNESGKLVFKEGLLIQAMKNGYWILLDELNLASSDVLEALNRVLDDNREIFIPEIQETIKAHPKFILFATQNPPKKYPGRKQLSKAFRNRFIELHFDDLPLDELNQIVETKCKLPSSYSSMLIKTVYELQTHRSQQGIFAGKNSLITLRDLFRWAKRYTSSEDLEADWKQYLAEHGLLILASRCRKEEDAFVIHKTIEKVFHVKIKIENIRNPQTLCKPIMDVLQEIITFSDQNEKYFVWTSSARRLALLVGLAYKFSDPFLLIGETGLVKIIYDSLKATKFISNSSLGKTRICQILSQIHSKKLHIINCHMNSEAADFLGSIRPVRDKENSKKHFEWQNGPLLEAVRNGDDFLIDEISLADDSVLERLNSLLESDRSILVSENSENEHSDVIYAHANFRLFATMNPGGDFGKKELSVALRNRFLEIWCPSENLIDEFEILIEYSITRTLDEITRKNINTIICSFIKWLKKQTFCYNIYISIRDLILWITFINKTVKVEINQESEINVSLDPYTALVHGACLIFIDSLSSDGYNCDQREICMNYLFETINEITNIDVKKVFFEDLRNFYSDEILLKCGSFFILKNHFGNVIENNPFNLSKYYLNSPTTSSNIMRLMRCFQMDNPIMLEGRLVSSSYLLLITKRFYFLNLLFYLAQVLVKLL